MLRKLLCALMATLMTLSFFGCSFDQFDEEKTGKEMEQILTQLFLSVQEGDRETFKTFFADDAVLKYDFEKGCDYVFDKYQGDLESVTFLSGGHTGKKFVPGEQIHYAFMTFGLKTSEREYEVVIEFYTQYESKYPNDPYKIRKMYLLNKSEDGSFEKVDSGISLRYGIYYPEWLSVKNIEGNESKINDRLSVIYSEYDKAEIIKYFYIRKGEQHIDTFCLIDVGDRLDLRSVITYNGGMTFDLESLAEDLQILRDYSVRSLAGDRKISFYVSDKQLNASEYEEIIEYSYNGSSYWFGIRSIACFD